MRMLRRSIELAADLNCSKILESSAIVGLLSVTLGPCALMEAMRG